MYEKVKKILFKFEPENAHNIAEVGLRILPYCKFINSYLVNKNFVMHPKLEQKVFNHTFYNPVGLAAGFDKNATMIKAMPALGFGFCEIGTFTPKPQSGNKKPRLFRFVEEESIQNAMGFNNDGSYKIQKRLQKIYPFSIPIGVNIGKNKITSEKDSIKDYEILLRAYKNLASYLVINISSPNTPGLRDLQNETFIKELFSMAKEITSTPILLKIAPDMEIDNAINLSKIAIEQGANGIIINNTSTNYSLLKNAKDFGGISGEAIREVSYNFFKNVAKEIYKDTTLISVGGISSADEAYRRIKAGATLVQVLTGLIFKGPSLVRDINYGLIKLLEKDGFESIKEAIGTDL